MILNINEGQNDTEGPKYYIPQGSFTFVCLRSYEWVLLKGPSNQFAFKCSAGGGG